MIIPNLPLIVRPHLLPRRWDVRKVWALDAPIHVAPIDTLTYLLDLPLWSSRPRSGMLFDCVPRKVLEDPLYCPYQFERVLQSDTSFPMDFIDVDSRRWVLDGVHRLARLVYDGADEVHMRVHNAAVLESITPDDC